MTAIDPASSQRRTGFLAALLLVCLTVAVYWPVGKYDFVGYDDKDYVICNTHVQNGISRESLHWAFTATNNSCWQPLVWLSYMTDFEIHGLKAGGFHLTNLILHVINVVLLFLVFFRMTRALYPAWFVAALFAVHPLHVESVAWIAERKDVLSTCFWLLTMGAYATYVEKPSLLRYSCCVLFFALGLMAKAMLVTLPFVLLLLDVWPLGRLSERGDPFRPSWKAMLRLVIEKAPLFLLAAGSCAITYLVPKESGAVITFDHLPLDLRLSNAVVSYVKYLGYALWPWNLAVFYPYPRTIPMWQWMTALAILVILSALAARRAAKAPFVAVGWFWFLGTLVPVIGIVQIGGHAALANRFAYVPFIGLYVAVAWGLPQGLRAWRRRASVLPALAIAAIACLAALTTLELRHWQDGITLFSRAVAVTQDNYIMYNNLGTALMREGRLDEAERQFREALRIQPRCRPARANLNEVLAKKAAREAAIARFSRVPRDDAVGPTNAVDRGSAPPP